MKHKLLFFSIVVFISLVILGGCKGQDTQIAEQTNHNQLSVIDLVGREVSLDGPANKVVAIGPGALRLFSYIGSKEQVVGVEQFEKDNPVGRPYAIANGQFKGIETIGPGGPNNSPDAEKLIAVNPDVIFTTYATDKATANHLQEQTGIPVVALSYGDTSVFDSAVNESLQLIGKIMDQTERANEVVQFFQQCFTDLSERTETIPEDEKLTAYVGAINKRGSHGIESTQGNYPLFQAVHAINVVDEVGKTGSLMIDKEKLIEWDPDKIFIDYGGLAIVRDDFKKNRPFYDTLSAFQHDEVYTLLPYGFYTINLDTALVDAYYIGSVLYPERFSDIQPEEKADDIYQFLLGKKMYEQMKKDFGPLENVVFK